MIQKTLKSKCFKIVDSSVIVVTIMMMIPMISLEVYFTRGVWSVGLVRLS